MKKTVLREYAKLIAKVGANVQKGQEVFITAELDQPEFVAMLVDECYKLKAKKVVVDWSYQPLTKLHVRYRSLKTLSTLDNYEEARWQHYVDTIPCRIYLISEDPDGLRGVNQEKMAKAQQAKYPIVKGYRDQIENKYQWCIAAVPGEKWAKKLFPELRASQAVEKLWDAILKTSRAKTMTMECGVRFLTDYLDGDHYFAVHRDGQNLDRARTQFRLVADMEKKWNEMQKIVAEEANKER